jgi:hypothetical protein
MHSEKLLSLVKPLENLRRIVWAAFIASTVAYVILAYAFFGQTGAGVEALSSNPLTIPFVILSIAMAVLAPIVPRRMMSDARMRQLISRPPEALARDPRTGAVNQDRLAKIKALAPDEQQLYALVSISFAPFVVRLAFNESIVLYGLVLAFLAKSFVAVLPFAVVSFALNLIVPSLMDSAMSRAASLGLGSANAPIQPR